MYVDQFIFRKKCHYIKQKCYQLFILTKKTTC